MTSEDRLSGAALASLQGGDRATIEEVLVRLHPHVRLWVVRYVGPTDRANDVVQEALIELTTALPKFRGDATITTFARRVTLRTASRYLRKHRDATRSIDPATIEVVDFRDPESQANAREQLAHLYECLATLAPKRRSAFMLCAVEGLTPSDAARIEGTTSLAMRSRLSRARADLTRILHPAHSLVIDGRLELE